MSETVRLARSFMPRSVIYRTISGSTSSHTVVSEAQKRSSASTPRYFLK